MCERGVSLGLHDDAENARWNADERNVLLLTFGVWLWGHLRVNSALSRSA